MSSGEPKILLIDDEEDLLTMYRAKFEHAGFEVVTASDGYEGLDHARQEQPDLILLDVLMPGMSGPDVLLKLKDIPEAKNIPVIFLTAVQDRPEDIKAAKEAGALDFINKATDMDAIIEQIREILNVAPNA